jgi:hypothetical protein
MRNSLKVVGDPIAQGILSGDHLPRLRSIGQRLSDDLAVSPGCEAHSHFQWKSRLPDPAGSIAIYFAS